MIIHAYSTWAFFSYRCECYDYLFDIAVQMRSFGLDPTQVPTIPKGAYVSKGTEWFVACTEYKQGVMSSTSLWLTLSWDWFHMVIFTKCHIQLSCTVFCTCRIMWLILFKFTLFWNKDFCCPFICIMKNSITCWNV